MSKYIKLADMENLIINIAPDGDVFTRGMLALQSLPTIEVSDKADRPFEYLEGYEDGRKSVEVSEDCISRADLLNTINAYLTGSQQVSHIKRIIENAPSVVPSRETGKWIDISTSYIHQVECSLCGGFVSEAEYDFCPHCGARME